MYRVGMKRNDNFYFHSFSDFSNLKAWNEAIMVSFNFLNFFAIFLEFSVTHRVGTEQNDNFYFFLSHPFPTYFGLKWILIGIFLIFLNFFVIFFEFSIMHRAGTKRNNNFLFSLFLSLFQPILAWNEAIMVFFNLLNFFAIFFGIFCYASDRSGTEL